MGKERGAYLKERIGTGKKVLDIGCRDGALTEYYAKGNDVTGTDIDNEALKRVAERLGIATISADLNNEWAFPPRSFDVVVAAEVIEHLYYPGRILDEISKVLKPGGLLVGSVPHAFSLQARTKLFLGMKRGTPLEDPTHINHFTYREFKKLLEDRFDGVSVTPLIPKRYRPFSFFSPFLFAEDILFTARSRKS